MTCCLAQRLPRRGAGLALLVLAVESARATVATRGAAPIASRPPRPAGVTRRGGPVAAPSRRGIGVWSRGVRVLWGSPIGACWNILLGHQMIRLACRPRRGSQCLGSRMALPLPQPAGANCKTAEQSENPGDLGEIGLTYLSPPTSPWSAFCGTSRGTSGNSATMRPARDGC